MAVFLKVNFSYSIRYLQDVFRNTNVGSYPGMGQKGTCEHLASYGHETQVPSVFTGTKHFCATFILYKAARH